MKKFLALLSACTIFLFAQAQSGKAIIFKTNSQKEVDKVLEALKGADPSTYHLTVTQTVNGKPFKKSYGTASIKDIKKVKSTLKAPIGDGNANASEIIVIVKSIASSEDIQKDIIQKLDQNLSVQKFKTIKMAKQL